MIAWREGTKDVLLHGHDLREFKERQWMSSADGKHWHKARSHTRLHTLYDCHSAHLALACIQLISKE
jgi:hypothetical protein